MPGFNDVASALDELATHIANELIKVKNELMNAAPAADGARTVIPDPIAIAGVVARITAISKSLNDFDSVAVATGSAPISSSTSGVAVASPAVVPNPSFDPSQPESLSNVKNIVASQAQIDGSIVVPAGPIVGTSTTSGTVTGFPVLPATNPSFNPSLPESSTNQRFI